VPATERGFNNLIMSLDDDLLTQFVSIVCLDGKRIEVEKKLASEHSNFINLILSNGNIPDKQKQSIRCSSPIQPLDFKVQEVQ